MPTAHVTITGQIFSKNYWGLIDQAFHDKAPDIRDIEVAAIRDRTMVYSGALVSSIAGDLFDYGNPDLVYLYPNDAEQIGAWGRVYASYQEGGPLGEGSNIPTSHDHTMFYEVTTTDLPTIIDWANGAASDAADLIGDHTV